MILGREIGASPPAAASTGAIWLQQPRQFLRGQPAPPVHLSPRRRCLAMARPEAPDADTFRKALAHICARAVAQLGDAAPSGTIYNCQTKVFWPVRKPARFMAVKLSVLKFLVGLGIFCNSSAVAATWTVSAPDTISMQGEIEEGDAARLANLLTSNIIKLVVNSNGGDAEEGLAIGKILLGRPIDVQVTGLCVSSCANYIFTAGARKLIKDGVVGYHGNISAVLDEDRSNSYRYLRGLGLFDQEIVDIDRRSEIAAEEESQFFRSLGISQALFDRTQQADKGMGDGKIYCLLVPTAAIFKKYGITDVEGEQSVEIISSVLKRCADEGAPVLIQ